jgi:hypothetical protein
MKPSNSRPLDRSLHISCLLRVVDVISGESTLAASVDQRGVSERSALRIAANMAGKVRSPSLRMRTALPVHSGLAAQRAASRSSARPTCADGSVLRLKCAARR